MSSEAMVYIVDDDEAVRDSLSFLLQSMQISSVTHESAHAFLEMLPSAKPQCCVVTDVRMPGMSGIDLLRRIKEMKIQMPVIIITGHGDISLAVEAMKLGAFDFVEKPFDDEAIVNSVRLALDQSMQAERSNADRAELEQRLSSLSSRERDVLNGLIKGNANKVIAAELAISPRTVEIYRANVMTKMKAASLSELVRMAIIAGLTV